MPAPSKAMRQAAAIAEHHPEKLHKENKGLAKMSHEQLHEFASTPEKHLPEHKKPDEKRGMHMHEKDHGGRMKHRSEFHLREHYDVYHARHRCLRL